MEYTQERVATLHDYGGARPDAPVERATVVVPMTQREYADLAAEGVLSTLERLSPERVLVPLRAPADRIAAFVEWLSGFDLPLEVLWCSGPRVEDLLASAGSGTQVCVRQALDPPPVGRRQTLRTEGDTQAGRLRAGRLTARKGWQRPGCEGQGRR